MSKVNLLSSGTSSPATALVVRPTAQGRASNGALVQASLCWPTLLLTSSGSPSVPNITGYTLRVPMEMLPPAIGPSGPYELFSVNVGPVKPLRNAAPYSSTGRPGSVSAR